MNRFPEYDVEDMVNFQKQFIEEKFGISHVKGLIGNSMGGFEVLTWGCVYPYSVDFIISLVSSFKVGGHNFALSKIMNNILESDPDYNDGAYDLPLSDSLKRSLKLSSDAMYCYGLSREEYRNNMTNEEIELAMAEFAEESLEEDPNDLIYMNNSSLDYDLTDQLENITAKVLIIAINQDQYFPPNLDAIPMSKMINDNKLLIFDSCMGHVGSNELFKVKEDLEGIPYVVRSKFNNGIKYNVRKEENFVLNPSNVISFGAENASFFYQDKEYISGRDMYYIDTRKITKNASLFIISCLEKLTSKYSYNFGLFPSLLKKEKIKLPVKTDGNPDYEYMDLYMGNIMKNIKLKLDILKSV